MSGGFDWFMDLSGESAVPLPTAEPVTPQAPWRSGERIAGRFELLEELGSGGMGVVYHARELSSGRSVAIKLMSGAMSPSQKERFRREGVVTAALRHPGIVSIHGAGAVRGAPYLVYEYVPGGRTYRDLLDEGAPRSDLLGALRDAADALGAAHAEGVVHRDVKPGNLLVTPEGQVRVADFGLVRAVGLEDLTKTGQVLGTPSYMPYEQFDGDRDTVDPTFDVWALGVILHEVIAGESPFVVANMLELIGAVQFTPIDPRRLAPSLEPELEAICKRALQRDPARRYPDAAAFAADLSSFLAGERPVGIGRGREGPVAGVLLAALLVASVLALAITVLLLTPPAETLTQALADYGAGRGSAEDLDAALVVNSAAPPRLRARAHVELAKGDGADHATWERRLAHAKSALPLDPERAAEGNALGAQALLELGRYEEAVGAFCEARRLGGPVTRLLEAAEALVGCSRWAEARRVLAAYRAEFKSRDRVATRLEVEVSIGLGEGRAALARRRDELTASSARILEAKLAQASGEDAAALFRELSRVRSTDTEVAEACARFHLERAELAEAIHALSLGKGTRDSLPPRLERVLGALAKDDVEPARELPRSWKLPVGRCMVRLARRELDLARQTADPRFEVGAGALSVTVRTERAQTYLAFVRSELAEDPLEQGLSQRSSGRGLLKRAQASLDGGDYTESLATLEEYAESNAYDLGPYEEFATLVAKLAVVLPSAEERLRVLTVVPAVGKFKRAVPGDELLPVSSPYDWTGLYRVSSPRLGSDSDRNLRACMLAIVHAPRLLRTLHGDLFRLSRSDELVGGRRALAELSSRTKGSTWLDRLTRAVLNAFAVVLEGAPPTTAELDQVLGEYPGIVFARVLRILVNTRAGNTIAAREDLAIVREVYAEDLYLTSFLNVLVLARERASLDEVTNALRAARDSDFRLDDASREDDYPELAPYLSDPTFRAVLMSNRRDYRKLRRAFEDSTSTGR
jgi:tetratricopeptide (TPR) repeat protein